MPSQSSSRLQLMAAVCTKLHKLVYMWTGYGQYPPWCVDFWRLLHTGLTVGSVPQLFCVLYGISLHYICDFTFNISESQFSECPLVTWCKTRGLYLSSDLYLLTQTMIYIIHSIHNYSVCLHFPCKGVSRAVASRLAYIHPHRLAAFRFLSTAIGSCQSFSMAPIVSKHPPMNSQYPNTFIY